MQTVKQIAAELGVTSQTVRNAIAKANVAKVQSKNNRAFLLSDEDAAIVKSAILEKPKEPRKTKNASETNKSDALFLLLQNEIEAKNKQIALLQEENARLIDALAKTTESLQAAQALHAATVKGQIEQKQPEPDHSEPEEQADDKRNVKRWWQFWR